jgi:uncharacterized protein with PIN domain
VSEVVRLQELIAKKEAQIQHLQADNQRQAQEIKLLKEKIDLLIRRIFGSKSEKLDAAQLELLLQDIDLGKADASAEKAEAAPIVKVLKPVAKRPDNSRRRERWPKELALEQEVIEPEEVRDNPEAFRSHWRGNHRDAGLPAGKVFPPPDHSSQVRAQTANRTSSNYCSLA